MKKALIVLSLLLVGSGIAQYLSLSTANEKEPAAKVIKVDKEKPQTQSYPDAKAPESTRYLFCNNLITPHLSPKFSSTPKTLLTPDIRPKAYIPDFSKFDGKLDKIVFCVQDAAGNEYKGNLNFNNLIIRITEDPKVVMSQIIPVFAKEAQMGTKNWFTEGNAHTGYDDPLKEAIAILTPQDYFILFDNN